MALLPSDGAHPTAVGTGLRGAASARERRMLDLLMLALGGLSFALFARYLLACERG